MNPLTGISPEEQLLIALCRLSFSDEQKERISALAKNISDTGRFTHLANEHGIVALACHNLKETGAGESLPREVMAYLENGRMKSLGRNTFLFKGIEEVLQLIEKEKIKTVLIKGMALELTVYGNAGLRQMNDVDILVPRSRCMQARKILLKNGFRSIPLKSPLYNLILPYYGKHLPEVIKGDLSVEIHHDLFAGTDPSLTKRMIDNSPPPVREFFLYLLRHLDEHEKNGESQLRLYTDLFLLGDKYGEELFNEALIKLSDAAGLMEILSAKLYILKRYWGVHLPPPLETLVNEKAPAGTDRLFRAFLSQPKGHPVAYNRSRNYRQAIKQIPGLHRKIIFIIGDLFPTLKFMKKRYNTRSMFGAILYYPHRLGKLVYLFKEKYLN